MGRPTSRPGENGKDFPDGQGGSPESGKTDGTDSVRRNRFQGWGLGVLPTMKTLPWAVKLEGGTWGSYDGQNRGGVRRKGRPRPREFFWGGGVGRDKPSASGQEGSPEWSENKVQRES